MGDSNVPHTPQALGAFPQTDLEHPCVFNFHFGQEELCSPGITRFLQPEQSTELNQRGCSGVCFSSAVSLSHQLAQYQEKSGEIRKNQKKKTQTNKKTQMGKIGEDQEKIRKNEQLCFVGCGPPFVFLLGSTGKSHWMTSTRHFRCSSFSRGHQLIKRRFFIVKNKNKKKCNCII